MYYAITNGAVLLLCFQTLAVFFLPLRHVGRMAGAWVVTLTALLTYLLLRHLCGN